MSDQLIYTKDGMIPSNLLEIRDVVEWHENFRVTATEWRLKSDYPRFDGLNPESKEPTYTVVPAGELVRRDVNANCLRGLSMAGEQANL
jgi:hypothetical protein